MTFSILPTQDYPKVLTQYQLEPYQFPIIESVLNLKQEGIILSPKNHEGYLIIHKFGFAQLIAQKKKLIWREIFKQLVDNKEAIFKNKIRLYLASDELVEYFLNMNSPKISISKRVKFFHESLPNPLPVGDGKLSFKEIDKENFESTEMAFNLDLFSRFWSSKESFLNNGLGVVALYNNVPASICYSAAIANNFAEVDIFTLPEFRKKGAAVSAASHFIFLCKKKNINPCWDCYENNTHSCNLAQKLGFRPLKKYHHIILG